MKGQGNIYLIGPMGVGKTTIGRHIANAFGNTFYDSDHEIEARTGVDINWIFDVEGEAGFRKRESEIIEELCLLDKIVLATGGGTVRAPENRKHLSSRGIVIYLKASVEQQLVRTNRSQARPLLNKGDPQKTLQRLHLELDTIYAEIADHTFNTDGRSVIELADEIVAFLADPIKP